MDLLPCERGVEGEVEGWRVVIDESWIGCDSTREDVSLLGFSFILSFSSYPEEHMGNPVSPLFHSTFLDHATSFQKALCTHVTCPR